jgi:uncharacterized membrane protein
VLACVAVCAACGWAHDSPVVAWHGGAPHGRHVWAVVFLAALAAAFVSYVAALWALDRTSSGTRFRAVFVTAAAIQLAPLATPLLLSSDAFSYWAYARVDNPYVDSPADAGVAARYAGRDWLGYTSVYGPAFSLAAEPTAAIDSPHAAAWTFKVAAALSLLAIVGLSARRSRRPAFAAAFVGWNPLLAVHFAGGGHNDALMMALVAAALALAERRRQQLAGVAWALAVLVKWAPLLLLPLRALEARARGRPVTHLGFAVTTVGVLALATIAYGLRWTHFLSPLAHNASRMTSYALPHRLGVPWWVLGALYAVAYVWLLREAWRGRARLGLALGLFLLVLPYLAVWYVIWTVPLAAGDDDRAAQVLALALCAYLLPQTIPV